MFIFLLAGNLMFIVSVPSSRATVVAVCGVLLLLVNRCGFGRMCWVIRTSAAILILAPGKTAMQHFKRLLHQF